MGFLFLDKASWFNTWEINSYYFALTTDIQSQLQACVHILLLIPNNFGDGAAWSLQ